MVEADRAGLAPIPDWASGRPVVLLAGSGSDEVFVSAAFRRPLGALGLRLVAPPPGPGGSVVASYLAALDAAVRLDPTAVVGGVSLGAQVAARWAAERVAARLPGPGGLMLALPAWIGTPGNAPAAVAARATAAALRRDGLAVTLARASEETPAWLGAELARAWTRHGAGLADSFARTARTPGPTAAQLAALRVPVGIVGLLDDPVHPHSVARAWWAKLPRSALVSTTLAAMGRDPETLGRAAALAWLRASG